MTNCLAWKSIELSVLSLVYYFINYLNYSDISLIQLWHSYLCEYKPGYQLRTLKIGYKSLSFLIIKIWDRAQTRSSTEFLRGLRHKGINAKNCHLTSILNTAKKLIHFFVKTRFYPNFLILSTRENIQSSGMGL